MPQLSVIVTCYNIEQYLPQCLESVLTQTLADLEVIVVDDGSTDRTPDIIRRVAERDPRVVPMLLAENSVGGVATAANVGLDRATARYVGFMDGDDYCEPTMFAALLAAATAHDADLAMCDYRLVDAESGDIVPPADAQKWSYLDREFYVLDATNRRRFLQFIAVPWRKIYRRAMLEDGPLRFPVGDYFYEDNPFHWYTVLSATSIALVPQPLCYHRVARTGQTMETADERLLRIFDHHWTIRSFLIDRDELDSYAPVLVSWAIGQMAWVAARTPDELRRDLFDRLRPILTAYDAHVVREGVTLSRRGRRVKQLVTAVRSDDLERFRLILDGPSLDLEPEDDTTSRLPPTGTLWQSARQAGARLRGRRTREEPPPMPEPGDPAGAPTDVTTRDLLFALAVLERRLDALERTLSARPPGAGGDDSGRPQGSGGSMPRVE